MKKYTRLSIILILSFSFLPLIEAPLAALEPTGESLGYVRVNRDSGVCTFYLKEGQSGKLVPITNESRTTTAPIFATIKYNGEVFKTTTSRFRLNVRNIENGFVIERKSTFVSFEEEITVINQLTDRGVERFFNVKLSVKNLRPTVAKIELRYVFDSFSKESGEAILIDRDTIVKESMLIDNFAGNGNVGYVTDFDMKPVWFIPGDDTRKEINSVIITNWKKLNGTPWFSRSLMTGDFFSFPESRADTALGFYFKEVSLDPGETVSYSFRLEGGTLPLRIRQGLSEENGNNTPKPELAVEPGKKEIGGTNSEITVTEKMIDDLLVEIDQLMLRVDTLSPEELANLTGKVETLERYKEIYEQAKR